MEEASAIPGWNDFFVATTGVAGALSGLHQIGTLPIVVGALGRRGAIAGVGIGWVAAGCILSMVVAMFSAWVLLIEILR